MRTLIRGGWVVGYAGNEHQVIRDGVCVVEDDRILHVGKDFEGQVDGIIDATGKLVSPGLISTHLHVGLNAGDYLFLDVGRPEAMGRNYLSWHVDMGGKQRYGGDNRAGITFGLGQCLRAGVTTVVDLGAGRSPETFVEVVEQLGIRAYSGPIYRNANIVAHPDGRVEYQWDERQARDGLNRAIQFLERFDGAAAGRLRMILCPGHPDTTDLDVLRETAEIARQRNLPVTIHAGVHALEADRTLEMYRLTPVQVLEKVGLLGTKVIVGHAVFVAGHSWTRFHEISDMKLLGDSHTSVSYSPFKYLHMGAYLESLRRYVEAGVNMTIGTDFPPSDPLLEMRYAMLSSRVADRNFLSGTPRQVFDAATVNAAKALGREDLGRLTPGAKADLVVFDMRKMHFGAVHDPIKSLVETGSGSDVELVMVDGKTVVDQGRLQNVDQAELLSRAQGEGEKIWADLPNWMWGGRSLEDVIPPSYPMI